MTFFEDHVFRTLFSLFVNSGAMRHYIVNHTTFSEDVEDYVQLAQHHLRVR